jgi:hypothetical protein
MAIGKDPRPMSTPRLNFAVDRPTALGRPNSPFGFWACQLFNRWQAVEAPLMKPQLRSVTVNVCHLYDVGPDYLVMEYVEGVVLEIEQLGRSKLPRAIPAA